MFLECLSVLVVGATCKFMIQACKRLQHSIQLQALISGLNTKGSNYLIAKTVISSNDSCFVTRLSVVGHASSQDSPMWDILRHRNVRCGTYTVTRLSDVGHVPSQDCPMWAMFRNGLRPPMDMSVSDSRFAFCTLTSCVSQQNRNCKQIPNKGRVFQRT